MIVIIEAQDAHRKFVLPVEEVCLSADVVIAQHSDGRCKVVKDRLSRVFPTTQSLAEVVQLVLAPVAPVERPACVPKLPWPWVHFGSVPAAPSHPEAGSQSGTAAV